jgi:tetratricopeptide (TPR) repeat protein
VYDSWQTVMRYENDGTGTREEKARLRVQTAAGLTAGGQLVFQYNAQNETVEIRSVRVIKPDGSTVTAGPDSVQDLSAPVAREAPMYTDARQKHVTVPGLAVGDTIEYDVLTNSRPLLAGQFWRAEVVDCDAVCVDRQIELNVPRGRPLQISAPSDVKFSQQDEGDRRVYRWSSSTLRVPSPMDVLKNFKWNVRTLLEGIRPPMPRVLQFSTFQTWSEVGEWYAALEHDRRVPTEEVRAQADQIVRRKTTDLQKAQALYDWVSTNIRYVSLSFGVGRYQPHAASEVLTNRYGDCKDKATLLDAMFEAEGLHAESALINSMMDVNPSVPSPLQFDHVITFVTIDGRDYWLDSTNGFAPFDYLLPQLRDKAALVVFAGNASKIMRTPGNLTMNVLYRVDAEGTVNKDGNFDATVKFETRGDFEVLIRALFARLSNAQFESILDQVNREMALKSKSTYEMKLTDLKVLNAADLDEPVQAQLHFVGKLTDVDLQSDSAADFSGSVARAISASGVLVLLPEVDSTRSLQTGSKQLAVQLNGPREYELNLSITVPTIKKTDTASNARAHISSDYAEYDASSGWEGQTFRAHWRLSLRVPEVPQEKARDYASFVQKVNESLQPAAVVVGKTEARNGESSVSKPVASVSSAASFVPSADAKALYSQGQIEARQQNWANAVERFQSAIKLEPNYADAWRELGRAHMYARDYPSAETAFRKYLGLAPDNRLAYLNIAWCLNAEKKFTESIAILEKRVATAPSDGDAHTRLGVAYLGLHQPERAIPELEQATSIYPRYEYAQFMLARAYLAAQQNGKAAAAFTRAVELNSSDSTLNDAAYQLADRNVSLDLAESWAARAVKTVELELNESTLQTPEPRLAMLVGKVGMYWDTLGWTKFREKDNGAAEKYILAAWQLRDNTTVGAHLGCIYEAEGRRDEAIEAFAQTLATIPSGRDMTDDEREARKHLAALLGNDALVDERVKQSDAKLQARRTISMTVPDATAGIAQFRLIVGPGSKVLDIAPLDPASPFANLTGIIRAAPMPQSLPDDTIQKLPRVGTLACLNPTQPCTFTLLSATAAATVAE